MVIPVNGFQNIQGPLIILHGQFAVFLTRVHLADIDIVDGHLRMILSKKMIFGGSRPSVNTPMHGDSRPDYNTPRQYSHRFVPH